jgi:hypothetical protein
MSELIYMCERGFLAVERPSGLVVDAQNDEGVRFSSVEDAQRWDGPTANFEA